MGMPTVITQSGTGGSAIWFPDWMQSPFNIGIQCVATGGTIQFSVQHTLDNIDVVNGGAGGTGGVASTPNAIASTAATWIDNPGITLATATINGNYAFPVRAIRVQIQSSTATGVVVTTFIQANYGGS
jgi:hypothetical protein